MKSKKIMLFTMLTMLFAVSLCIIGFAETSAMEEFKNPNGVTLCVSDMGNTNKYPENSKEAISSAFNSGADIVKIHLQKTKDGQIILFKDSTLFRMCNDNREVSTLKYDEIKNINLLNRKGGSQNKVTSSKIPLLSDTLNEFKDKTFILDFDFSIKDEVYSIVKSCNSLNSVIFYIGHQKPDDIVQWQASLPSPVEIITYFKGNVIFSATDYIKNSIKANASAVCLATKNPYGVIFGNTVDNTAKGEIRKMALSSQPEICGKIRRDNSVWWDDLISRGFSIILTDNVSELRKYIDESQNELKKLKESYSYYNKSFILPDFKTASYIDYKKAYNDAIAEAERLMNMKNVSRSQAINANSALTLSINNITEDYDELSQGKVGYTITPARIIVAVLAVIGVTVWEVYVIKHRKKA